MRKLTQKEKDDIGKFIAGVLLVLSMIIASLLDPIWEMIKDLSEVYKKLIYD